MSLFTPAWKSDNIEKALKAIEKSKDKNALTEIVETAASNELRIAAITRGCKLECSSYTNRFGKYKIKNNVHFPQNIIDFWKYSELLEILSFNQKPERRPVVEKLYEKISEKISAYVLVKITKETGISEELRLLTLDYMSQADLYTFFEGTKNMKFKEQALQKITDPKLLKKLVYGEDEAVSITAIKKVDDPDLLGSVIENSSLNKARAALDKLVLINTDRLFDAYLCLASLSSDNETNVKMRGIIIQKLRTDHPDILVQWKQKLREKALDQSESAMKCLKELGVAIEKDKRLRRAYASISAEQKDKVLLLAERLNNYEDDPYTASNAARELKSIYKNTISRSVKDFIENIPQKTYSKGYSIGSKANGCHDDVPTVSFYLDD